jgi:hypothetical protein
MATCSRREPTSEHRHSCAAGRPWLEFLHFVSYDNIEQDKEKTFLIECFVKRVALLDFS